MQKWSKGKIEEDVEIAHVLVVFLKCIFGMWLSFPCSCLYESSVPVQDIVSGSSIVNKVADFTVFNEDLSAYGKIY